MKGQWLFPLFLLLSVALAQVAEDAPIAEVLPTGSVVSIRRSVDTGLLQQQLQLQNNKTCEFDGGTIVVAGPSSLGLADKYYFQCHRQLLGYQLIMDHVNEQRCGVLVDGKHYKLELQTYGDKSNAQLTAVIANKLVHAPYSSDDNITQDNDEDPVDLIVAGYSSSLTAYFAGTIAKYNVNASRPRLMISPGSALTANFEGRPYCFTTVSPIPMFIAPALQGLATQTTAKTVATVWEDSLFTWAACAAAPLLANAFGLDLVAQQEVPASAPVDILEPVVSNFSSINPDVVISCVYDCVAWHQAMRNKNWSPKAQVYTICIGFENYKKAFDTDIQYMMGTVGWDESVVATDALTKWTAQEFSTKYKALSSDGVVSQDAIIAASTLSMAIQAMEATNTISDADVLAQHLSTNSFPTFGGDISFDENGQNNQPLLLVQYDQKGVLQTTFPIEKSSGQIVYPMPTWEGRDCVHVSDCVKIQNYTCSFDGYCECPNDYTATGIGATARCVSNAILFPPTSSESTWSSPGVIFGIVAAVLVAVGMLAWASLEQKKRQNDAVWQVAKEEIKFDDPPVVVGRGTFGVVLLAEYRGTEVAVKRVIPPKKKGSGGDGDDDNNNNFQNDGSNVFKQSVTASTTLPGHSSGMNSGAMMNGWSSGSASGTASFFKSGTGFLSSTFLGSKNGILAGAVAQFNVLTGAERRQLEKDFLSEMRYLSKLRHPCITTVMGAVVKKGEDPMLVMEYMYHGSLYDILHNNTMVLEGEILHPIMRDISSGLRFLHSSNPPIIHGDLKAANILVDSNFRAKVADFGLSQKHKLGAAAGTPFWMAPELIRGTSVNTTASDAYAYGIILYEVFSRKDPYEGEDAKEVMCLVADPKINKRPPVPRDCPPLIEGLMTDCLVEDPEERPTFEEVDVRLKRMDISKVETPASRDKSTISLFDIFPKHIAEALRDGREVESEHKDMVTIFFSDIVGFTNISSTLEPKKVAAMLDRLYTKFDDLSEKHDIFKVETIGDAYMAVTNLVKDQPDDHVKRIAEFAIEAIEAANETPIDASDPSKGCVNIRVGFHSGPVVADVVGNRNPRYCLFGDTVNTASRMESNSRENRIHCSHISAKLLKKQDSTISIKPRGVINVKGKGKQRTYWINEDGAASPKSENLSPTEMATILAPLQEESAEFRSGEFSERRESKAELSLFSSTKNLSSRGGFSTREMASEEFGSPPGPGAMDRSASRTSTSKQQSQRAVEEWQDEEVGHNNHINKGPETALHQQTGGGGMLSTIIGKGQTWLRLNEEVVQIDDEISV